MRGIIAATVAAWAIALCASSATADGHAGRHSWTGLYIGAHAGGGRSDIDISNFSFVVAGGDSAPFEGAAAPDADGFIGGGQVGYNFQSGNFVAGIELSFSGTNISGEDFGTFVVAAAEDDNYTVEINSIFQAVLRLGYAWDKALVYGKIGFASADIYSSVIDTSDENPGAAAGSFGETNEWHSGLVLGAGLEYALTDNISIGVDYTYINFQDQRHSNGLTSDIIDSVSRDIDLDLHAVMARISYKFGPRHSIHRPLK